MDKLMNKDWLIKELTHDENESWSRDRNYYIINNHEREIIINIGQKIVDRGHNYWSNRGHILNTSVPVVKKHLISFGLGHNNDLTIFKYQDDWFVIVLYISRESKTYLCDTIEGVKLFTYEKYILPRL